jgi:hypothetical protein
MEIMIQPLEPGGPKNVNKKRAPNENRFKDQLKVDKVDAVHLDEQRKRRLFKEEDEAIQNAEPSPYLPHGKKTPPKTPNISDDAFMSLPADTTEDIQQPQQPSTSNIYTQPPPTDNKQVRASDQVVSDNSRPPKEETSVSPVGEKEKQEGKKKRKKQDIVEEKEVASAKKQKQLSKASSQAKKFEEEMAKASTPPPKEEAVKKLPEEPSVATTTPFAKKEKAITTPTPNAIVAKEKTPSYVGAVGEDNPFSHKKDKKEDTQMQVQSQSMGIHIDNATQVQTSSLSAQVSSYLSPDILPLFERMVGTLIQINKQGISETQIILNSPAFANSQFFGSKIFFERYSTAPNSFNIKLTGPQQAVTIFNDNLSSLMNIFQGSKLDFKVGRLYAEYETERPLFRRKKSIGDESKDMSQ